MDEFNITDLEAVLERIRAQVDEENFRLTPHAQQEMVEENIILDEILEAVATGQVLENYAEHRRGACCLLNGVTRAGRPLHIVCTTARPVLIIITVYEPKPPKWITPIQRRR
ncbi:MAG: DUF4258 domain-containing protein [Candidatus Latescibacteria bacterium]|nr:DUF4258 domain-containing protein [Candidatus Latescibacterota bacterium]